jgi:tetratricopeptide (TPR) repeat protein
VTPPSQVLREAVARHRAGDLKGALEAYRRVLKTEPENPSALHGEGLVLEGLGKAEAALRSLRRAVAVPQPSPLHWFNLARVEARHGTVEAALDGYRAAVRLKPDFADAWNNLGLLLETRHDRDRAEHALRQAVDADPGHVAARVNLARLFCSMRRREEASLVLRPALQLAAPPAEAWFLDGTLHEDSGRYDAALASYRKALERDPSFDKARNNIGTALLGKQHYGEARDTFLAMFRERRGNLTDDPGVFDARSWSGPPGISLRTCRARLEDMAAQYRHLLGHGLLDPSWEEAAGLIDNAIAWHDDQGLTGDQPHVMTGAAIEAMAGLHERAVRFADNAPLTGPAIGVDNDYGAIEEGYQASPTSVTIIDNFLSPEALGELRRFCLGSTVFFGHNATGYVTSYMSDGFASSLLYRIAGELQQAMPSVLGGRHLHNMWVYRHRNEGAGVNAHTDDASVTFNFWITQDEASLDRDHGGLVVYAREQPLDWDWHDINLRKNAPDVKARIGAFLDEAEPVTVPHRANRAVLFHSNLFHMSDRFRFREGFENRRVNVTLLFGERGS